MSLRCATCCALLALLAIGCHRPPSLRFSGTLEVTEHAVGARVSARIATLAVDEGDEVKADQLIATLDRYDQMEREFQRNKQLAASGGVAKEALEHSALALEDQKIISPIDGTILVKVHEVGEVVGANTPVVVIGDRTKMWVRIFIPEGHVSQIRMRQPATIRVDGLDRAFKGHVSFIAPKAAFTPRNVQTREERVTQTFAVKVALDEFDPVLRPGVAAEVRLESVGPFSP